MTYLRGGSFVTDASRWPGKGSHALRHISEQGTCSGRVTVHFTMLPARVLLIPLLRSARPLLQHSLQQQVPRYRRSFSSTPPPRAAESQDAFISAFKNTTLFRKLADKPDALKALENFAKLLQGAGTHFCGLRATLPYVMLNRR